VVEDGNRLGDILKQALQGSRFTVDTVTTADDAEGSWSCAYDAAVLDIGYTKADGIGVLQATRRGGGRLPI